MAPRALRRALVGASALACTSALVLLPVLGAAAIDYDVDDSGGATYTTIQQAVDAATGAGVTAGDRVVVAAGSYAGFTVAVDGLAIVGDGPATTIVTGQVTLNGTTELTGFTFQGQATVPTPGAAGPTAIHVNASAEGSSIHDNVIENAERAIYAVNVDSTAADPLTIEDNVFRELYGASSATAFLHNSSDVVYTGNTFQNAIANGDAVGVNLLCGSDDVLIEDNDFINVGNAVVVIAADCGGGVNPSTNIDIVDNRVDGFAGSGAFFIAPNNVRDLVISGNVTKNTSNAAGAAVRFADLGFYAATGGLPLGGIVISGNTFTDAVYGVRVQGGAVDLESAGLAVANNVFCRNSTADIQNDNATAIATSGNIFTCSLTTLPGGTGGGAATGQLGTLAVTGGQASPAALAVALLLLATGVGFVVRSRFAALGRHTAR